MNNHRDISWFQIGMQLLLVSAVLGMFYGISLAHTLVASAEATPVVEVNSLNIAFEHCGSFDEYTVTVDELAIPADVYDIVCNDTGSALVQFHHPLLLDREPTSFSLNGFNR